MNPKSHEKSIPRDPLKIPKPGVNPIASLIRDTLEHHGLTQAEAARAMRVSPGTICDIIKDRKAVSTDMALRLERCLGIPAVFILKVQTDHQYCVAYHSRAPKISAEVRRLVPV